MSSDSQMRWQAHTGKGDPRRMEGLDRRRQARAGDWSEQELEAALLREPLPGRAPSEIELRRALLGAGELDRRLSLAEAAAGLGLDEVVLAQAAQDGQLATLRHGDRLYTSESRLGAWLLSQGRLPAGANSSFVLRLVYLCGLAAGRRCPARPTAQHK